MIEKIKVRFPLSPQGAAELARHEGAIDAFNAREAEHGRRRRQFLDSDVLSFDGNPRLEASQINDELLEIQCQELALRRELADFHNKLALERKAAVRTAADSCVAIKSRLRESLASVGLSRVPNVRGQNPLDLAVQSHPEAISADATLLALQNINLQPAMSENRDRLKRLERELLNYRTCLLVDWSPA